MKQLTEIKGKTNIITDEEEERRQAVDECTKTHHKHEANMVCWTIKV